MCDMTLRGTSFSVCVCPSLSIVGLLLIVISLLTGCGGGDTSGQPTIAVSPDDRGTGGTARLTWEPVPDASILSYFVHYGRQSSMQSGSCGYERAISVDSPSATITNLDLDTRYYFAVSAYNGLESSCSNEVSIMPRQLLASHPSD
jgi:hypothetical protein